MFDLSWDFDDEDFFGFLDDAKADLIIRDWLHEIADFAEDSYYRHVPYASGRTLAAINKSRVNKTPYGYTVEVGIGPIFGLHYGESPEYPVFVDQGTGIFGPEGESGLITPQNGNVIAFEKLGEGTIFTRFVEGQEAQNYSEKIHEEVDAEIVIKKAELAVMLSALD
jgi:hypothetical protein